jgi:hypothetical protein
MPIEIAMSESVRALSLAMTPIEDENPLVTRQRAEGEFLRQLVAKLQPMLRDSMRSHRIFLASDTHGTIALESDGIFVHFDIADQQNALDPAQVLCAEPSLLLLLGRIEAELVAADDVRATGAAEIVRLARHSLQVNATEP